MDDHRQGEPVGQFQLHSECRLLFLDELSGPVAVHADFPDCPYLPGQVFMYLFHFLFPGCIDGCGVEAEAWEYRSFMPGGDPEHVFSGLRVYVREYDLRDSRFDGAGDREVFLSGEGLVVQVGMRVDECHKKAGCCQSCKFMKNYRENLVQAVHLCRRSMEMRPSASSMPVSWLILL